MEELADLTQTVAILVVNRISLNQDLQTILPRSFSRPYLSSVSELVLEEEGLSVARDTDEAIAEVKMADGLHREAQGALHLQCARLALPVRVKETDQTNLVVTGEGHERHEHLSGDSVRRVGGEMMKTYHL